MFVEKGNQAIKDHDGDEAFKCYSKATALGCTKAEVQSELGDCYQIGFGVEKDEAKAVEWFSKAAAQGHAWSQYQMGICLYNGRGIPKDTDRAIEMWRRSAAQGFHLAVGVLEQLKNEGKI
jgi:TPR repeat protein